MALAGGVRLPGAALHNGLLSVVQPLLVTELVFALVLRRLWVHQTIRSRHLVGGGADLSLAALFIAMSEPSGGNASRPAAPGPAPSRPRRVARPCSAALVPRLARPPGGAARRGHVAVLWALVATFIKAMTDTLTQFGVAACSPTGPSTRSPSPGLAAELVNQAALHVGPLSMSQPFIVVVDPIVSIGLSVWIFAETFSESVPRLAFGSLAFAGMCVSVLALTRHRTRHHGSRHRAGRAVSAAVADLRPPWETRMAARHDAGPPDDATLWDGMNLQCHSRR